MSELPKVPPFQFLVSVEYGVAGVPCVLVRWLRRLGKRGSGMYSVLEGVLEEVDGVESVRMGRYSAVLEVADHVATAGQIADGVKEALVDDGELKAAVKWQFPKEFLDVTVVGQVFRV
jgi:hypothetical protein